MCDLLVGKNVVDFAQPVQTGVIVAGRKGVEIRDNVVTFNDGIQQLYQVQQGLKNKIQRDEKHTEPGRLDDVSQFS